MKIAIITSRYPKENEPYNHMFVHVRALYFASQGIDVEVLVPAKINNTYTYQGISVNEDNSSQLVKKLPQYDLVYLHLLNQYPLKNGGYSIYNAIMKNKLKAAIYIHGSEVLTYPDYLFDFHWNVKSILKVCYTNLWKRYFMSKFLQYAHAYGGEILTPSKWMGKQIELLYHIRLSDINIVANGIDTTLFCKTGGFDKRFKLLCLKPLNDEYPLEETIKFMENLPERFTLDIYGLGPNSEKLKKLIKELKLEDRVRIVNKFFKREEVADLLANYGVFVSFSKLDTQGVSMCEAMSAGLLVLSTSKTCIPEFVENNVTGLLVVDDNYIELAERVIQVCNNEEVYLNITTSAREFIGKIEYAKQGEKELSLLNKIMNGVN